MKKIETIWHYLLISALNEKNFKHTQQKISNKLGFSLSTTNHALKVPSQIGAVRKETKFFVLENFQKLLYYWASMRNLAADIIYSTFVDENVLEIESQLPAKSIYAAYSAARKILKEPPADYSSVYCYLDFSDLALFKDRFPHNKSKKANLFVLKMGNKMAEHGEASTLPQVFVDIWNLKDWYSSDFTKKLEEKMNELLS